RVTQIRPGAMPTAGYHLSIVVPIYNGAEQLAASLGELTDFIGKCAYRTELILANDGSGQATVQVLEEFAATHPEVVVLRHLPHRGKGAVICAAMREARGRYRVFIDSDAAYPAREIGKVVAALQAGSDVAIACRVLPESLYVISPRFFHYMYTRHLMSRVLNAIVRAVLLPGLRDTQAGLKGFTAASADRIFPKLRIPGFGFDLECLFAARVNSLSITQVPVVFRYGEEPSTIR